MLDDRDLIRGGQERTDQINQLRSVENDVWDPSAVRVLARLIIIEDSGALISSADPKDQVAVGDVIQAGEERLRIGLMMYDIPTEDDIAIYFP